MLYHRTEHKFRPIFFICIKKSKIMENREIQVIAKYELAYRNKIYYAGDKIMMLEKDVEGDYKNDVLVAEEEPKKQDKKSKKQSK